jgi:hypothetical protein
LLNLLRPIQIVHAVSKDTTAVVLASKYTDYCKRLHAIRHVKLFNCGSSNSTHAKRSGPAGPDISRQTSAVKLSLIVRPNILYGINGIDFVVDQNAPIDLVEVSSDKRSGSPIGS